MGDDIELLIRRRLGALGAAYEEMPLWIDAAVMDLARPAEG